MPSRRRVDRLCLFATIATAIGKPKVNRSPAMPSEVAGLDQLPTPALVFDAQAVAANIERMAAYGRQHKLGIRPHTKTHKSLKLAQLQLEAGACGLTVAKVGEAEVMSELDAELLIAYPVFDSARKRRVADLAKRRQVIVAIDSQMAADELALAAREAHSRIGILVDLDVGMGRTGVATPRAALELAQTVARHPGLQLEGIMCYPGHIWCAPQEQAAPLAAVSAKLRETIDLWHASGLTARIVSGGSTPTAYQSHLVPEFTEIRPGTYIFNDINEYRGGYSSIEQCAARIIVTVISSAVSGQVVIDGGSKTFTSDSCVADRDSGFGQIVGFPSARISRLSEEHGQVDVRNVDRPPQLGQRLAVIPNHICPCVNLQDYAWWLRDDGTLERLTIDTRGLLDAKPTFMQGVFIWALS
jgi:D-serine deaminase-like pyridoxal phosphate-dependent protein